jgi:hypothetical protein
MVGDGFDRDCMLHQFLAFFASFCVVRAGLFAFGSRISLANRWPNSG